MNITAYISSRHQWTDLEKLILRFVHLVTLQVTVGYLTNRKPELLLLKNCVIYLTKKEYGYHSVSHLIKGVYIGINILAMTSTNKNISKTLLKEKHAM
jgi:hypothetical protein